ncbi:MAG TPA: DUF4956 domain-containing protein [Candidatus Limiplasma sp.]|nr:DUF4956 domain-containing protein [Candidatus Limiplasma sp.]
MLDSIFARTTDSATIPEVLVSLLLALFLGFIISRIYMWKSNHSPTLAVGIILMPAVVQAVIFLVNGNLGTGLAVMGAFTLVRFRSVAGSAKDITCIFFAMAVGLATGMGYALYAVLFTVVVGGAYFLLSTIHYGEKQKLKGLRITIPEDLEYDGLFDDLFREFTDKAELYHVKTTNLGSLFELQYRIIMKDETKQKALIDGIRCRNGNLGVTLGNAIPWKEEL